MQINSATTTPIPSQVATTKKQMTTEEANQAKQAAEAKRQERKQQEVEQARKKDEARPTMTASGQSVGTIINTTA